MNPMNPPQWPSIQYLIRIRQVRRSETQRPEQLIQHQQQRLRRLLAHVVARSGFYREYYREHGIDIGHPGRIRLEDLPIIDKQIMMANFDRFVCDKHLKKSELEKFITDPATTGQKYLRKYVVTHTSGSSGRIGLFVYGPNDWAMLRALSFTRISGTHLHWPRKLRYAFVGVIDGHYAGITLSRSGPKSVVEFLADDNKMPIAAMNTALNQFQPDVLSGYAAGIYQLALEQLKGNLKISPEKIICSAEALTRRMADVIQQAFGVRPFNCYAATESIAMAAECARHDGLHLFNDWHIFEVLKADGTPAGPGESGNLIVTTLYNYTQPLIRYRMDDQVILDDRICPCGWPFPLIKAVGGRVEEQLRFARPDGTVQCIHPFVFIEFFVVGLEKMQVVQTGSHQLRLNVKLSADPAATMARIRNKMDMILQAHHLSGLVAYEINPVDDIPNDPKTGKFRMVIPQS